MGIAVPAYWLGAAALGALGWYMPGGGRDLANKALSGSRPSPPPPMQMSPSQQADAAKKEADKEKGNAGTICEGCPPAAGQRPPNLAPEGAGRDEALDKLKEDHNIEPGIEPDVGPQRSGERNDPGAETLGYLDKDGNYVEIPHHYGGHDYPDDPSQNRGPHFNGPDGSHYDYDGPGQPFGPLRRR